MIAALLPIRRCAGVPLIRLFCVPHAGGVAANYVTWAQQLPDVVEVCGLQLPGHGSRGNEPAAVRAADLAAEIADGIEATADLPYALFGHSMGALLAFEAARLLRDRWAPAPLGLLVSSARSPDRWSRLSGRLHLGSDADLIAMMREQGGTPPEVFDHPDLVARALPPLRADLQVCETYSFAERPPLAVPIAVLGGTADSDVTVEDLAGWVRHSTAPVSVQVFDGGHFYQHDVLPQLLGTVGSYLDSWAALTPDRRPS